MAIELSNLTFTEQDDIVPSCGVEQIFNTGVTNTLAGDDIITGIINLNDAGWWAGISNFIYVDSNDDVYPILSTGDGNDTITGIAYASWGSVGIYNERATIDTGDGNDIITGIGDSYGILTQIATIDTGNGDDIITAIGGDTGIISMVNTTINTGDGNDIITATGGSGWGILLRSGAINTGEGNDIINGTGDSGGLSFSTSDFIRDRSRIDTGEGDDIITGTGSDYGIANSGTVNTGNGKDSIISYGVF